MGAWTDLHCHWVSGIDDGARTPEEGAQMLRELQALGFGTVIATPHMRPGMFDNEKANITSAFDEMSTVVAELNGLNLSLACEHYFDDIVYARIAAGEGLPYPGGKAVLLEFWEIQFPTSVIQLLAKMKRSGLLPVIAHPERYRAVWDDPEVLDRLLDNGAVALLDVAALVGKYGRKPRAVAEQLLEDGLYCAGCSDAHRPDDVTLVGQGIELIRSRYGQEEVESLLSTGPASILDGTAQS